MKFVIQRMDRWVHKIRKSKNHDEHLIANDNLINRNLLDGQNCENRTKYVRITQVLPVEHDQASFWLLNWLIKFIIKTIDFRVGVFSMHPAPNLRSKNMRLGPLRVSLNKCLCHAKNALEQMRNACVI